MTVCFHAIGAVADQAAGMDEVPPFVDRRDPMAGCQSGELIAPRAEESLVNLGLSIVKATTAVDGMIKQYSGAIEQLFFLYSIATTE